MNLDTARRWAQAERLGPTLGQQAYGPLLDRLAELEGGEVTTEWGVGDPDACHDDATVQGINGPDGMSITDRHYGRALLRREVRRGPWTAAS